MATATSSNAPTRLRDDGVFIYNNYTLIVDVTDEVVIEAPVTAVVLINGVPSTNPALVVTPIVTGRRITTSMTTAQLALLPPKKASLNILFNGEYVIQKPMTPTTEGTVPSSVTELYSDSTLGVFRVSFYHGATQASLTEEDRIACEAARDYIDDAMVQINDRVPQFLDDFANTILAGHDAEYTSIHANPLTASGPGTGATIDVTNKIVNITSGNSGAGAFMRQDFDLLSADNLRVNDKINMRCKITQSIDGAISASVIGIRVFTSTGVAVPFTNSAPSLYDPVTKTYIIDGQFTVTNTSFTYYVEFYIKAGAPNQTANVALRWIDTGINQDKYLYKDAITLVDEATRGYQGIAVTFDDQPIITAIDLTGVSDVKAALQAEFDLAVSTSGKWIGREGTPRIASSLTLNGKLDLDFGGMDVNVAIATPAEPTAGAEMFYFNTAKPVFIRNLIARRLASNPTHAPTFCRFNSTLINVGSMFERVNLQNISRGMILDYCDGLEIVRCTFGGGEFQAIRAGVVAPASMTNLKIRFNKFYQYLNTQCQVANLNGLVVEQNDFFSTSAGTFPNRALELIPLTGSAANRKVRILNNSFMSYREYGVYLNVIAGTSVNDIQFLGNLFDDRTPDATDNSSRGMHIAGVAKNISMLDIMHNHFYCKEIGIRIDNATSTRIQNNDFWKSNVGGAYATSQAILGSNLDYFLGGTNILDSALGVATTPGSWTASNVYTTLV